MTTRGRRVPWGVERRLEFIEFRLFWEGGVNRADLIDAFGISVPQASKDLSLYQERAPGNVVYDKSAKRYVASEGFKPLFLDSDPDEYFSRLRSLTEGSADPADSWLAQPPDADVALTPKRDVDRQVLRTILAAIRNKQSVEILYQSMNKARPDPSWRRITPHALGYDGLRWHVRAFSHDEGNYQDFLLPRALEVRAPGEPGGSAENDQLWHQHFKLEIAPHPALTPSQKKVVAKDYGMTGGKRSDLRPPRDALLCTEEAEPVERSREGRPSTAAHHRPEQGRGAAGARADGHGKPGAGADDEGLAPWLTTRATCGTAYERMRQAFADHDLGHVLSARSQHGAQASVVAGRRAFRRGAARARDARKVEPAGGNDRAQPRGGTPGQCGLAGAFRAASFLRRVEADQAIGDARDRHGVAVEHTQAAGIDRLGRREAEAEASQTPIAQISKLRVDASLVRLCWRLRRARAG